MTVIELLHHHGIEYLHMLNPMVIAIGHVVTYDIVTGEAELMDTPQARALRPSLDGLEGGALVRAYVAGVVGSRSE